MKTWLLKLFRKSIKQRKIMHIYIDRALGKRKCSSCKGEIKKGEICVRAEGGWNAQTHSAGNLCRKCLTNQLKRENLQVIIDDA